jgi:hypothetical protein
MKWKDRVLGLVCTIGGAHREDEMVADPTRIKSARLAVQRALASAGLLNIPG